MKTGEHLVKKPSANCLKISLLKIVFLQRNKIKNEENTRLATIKRSAILLLQDWWFDKLLDRIVQESTHVGELFERCLWKSDQLKIKPSADKRRLI
jgi:hypothetical protein